MALMEKLNTDRPDLANSEIVHALFGQALAEEAVNHRGAAAPDGFVRATVHIVADNEQKRAQMARLVFSAGHHAEVYADAEELVRHAPTGGVILAHEMEDGRCPALLSELAAFGLWLPLLGFAEQLSIEAVVKGIKAGVLDYMVGAASVETVRKKIQVSYNEGVEINAARRHQVLAKQLVNRLSHREGEVLVQLADGASNKEIARSLSISPRTVEIHRMKMMGKIGARHCAEAVRIFLEARGVI